MGTSAPSRHDCPSPVHGSGSTAGAVRRTSRSPSVDTSTQPIWLAGVDQRASCSPARNVDAQHPFAGVDRPQRALGAGDVFAGFGHPVARPSPRATGAAAAPRRARGPGRQQRSMFEPDRRRRFRCRRVSASGRLPGRRNGPGRAVVVSWWQWASPGPTSTAGASGVRGSGPFGGRRGRRRRSVSEPRRSCGVVVGAAVAGTLAGSGSVTMSGASAWPTGASPGLGIGEFEFPARQDQVGVVERAPAAHVVTCVALPDLRPRGRVSELFVGDVPQRVAPLRPCRSSQRPLAGPGPAGCDGATSAGSCSVQPTST